MADKTKDVLKDLTSMVALQEKLKSLQEDLNKKVTESEKLNTKINKKLEDQKEDLTLLLEEQKKIVKSSREGVAVSAKLLKINRDIRDSEEEVAEFAEDYAKAKKEAAEAQKDLLKGTNDLGNNVDEIAQGAGKFGKIFKSSPMGMRGAAKEAGTWAKRMKDVQTAATGAGGKLSLAAKATGRAGNLVGSISGKMLGPAGWAVMGVKALVDGVMKYDTWIKSLNKNFAMVRGPDVFTPDVQKQMKDFNDQIYSIGDNLKDGLNSKEVMTFIDTVYQAGMSLSKLNNGFTNYRTAVHIAAKASAVFGMDLTQTGSIMANMMNNMKMSLSDVDKAFVDVSYDAQRSGLSTDAFWQTVQNATASLSLYGIGVKGVAHTLAQLQKTQVAGSEEVKSTVVDLTKAFSEMEPGAAAGFMQIAQEGGGMVDKMFNDLADKARDNIKTLEGKKITIQSKIDEKKAKGEDISVLQNTLADMNKTINNSYAEAKLDTEISKAIKDGQWYEAGKYLAKLSDKAPVLLMKLLKGGKHGLNLQTLSLVGANHDASAAMAIMKSMFPKLSTQEQMLMLTAIKQSADEANRIIGVGEQGNKNGGSVVKKMIDLQNTNSLSNQSLDTVSGILGSLNDKTDPSVIAAEAKTLSQILDMNEADSQTFLENLAANSELKGKFSDYFKMMQDGKKLPADMLSEMTTLVNSTDNAAKMYEYGMTHDKKSSGETKKAYDNTFSEIRDQTTSFEKMKDIVKDGSVYSAGSLLLLRSMDKWITKIGTEYLGGVFGSYDTNKEAKEGLKKLGVNIAPGGETARMAEEMKKMVDAQAVLENEGASQDNKDVATKQLDLSNKIVTYLQQISDGSTDIASSLSNIESKETPTSDDFEDLYRKFKVNHTDSAGNTKISTTDMSKEIPIKYQNEMAKRAIKDNSYYDSMGRKFDPSSPYAKGLTSPVNSTGASPAAQTYPKTVPGTQAAANGYTPIGISPTLIPSMGAGNTGNTPAPPISITINASDVITGHKLGKAVEQVVYKHARDNYVVR